MKTGRQSSGIKSADTAGSGAGPDNLLSRPLIIALLLALVTLFVYWPVRQCEFLGYDDPLYFTQNAHVLNGLSGDNVVWAFTTGTAANWHPLTWLSLMLDAELFGNQPAGPHLVNLLFHIANSILVFVVLRRLTAAVWCSALVAALFALHPLHVESVAWVAERKDLLCGFFVLLTLWCYAKAVQNGGAVNSAGTKGRMIVVRQPAFLASLIFFMLALLSKPMAVTVPFVLLLLDVWPLNRLSSPIKFPAIQRLVLEKFPFFGLSLAASVITCLVQAQGNAVASLATFPLSVRIENAFVSYARYLAKAIWPAVLANPYPHPGHWPSVAVILSILLLAGVSLLALWSVRKLPFVFTGWFWFVGMLVPVIGLVQVGAQSMADRYSYLPSIGLLIVAAWGVAAASARFNFSKPVLVFLAVAVLAASAARTRQQLGYWQNDGTLFAHALACTENNSTASVNLGSWYLKNGQNQAALDQYNAALKMKPTDPLVLYDLGNAFASLGNFDEAINDYRRALQLAPNRPNILNNLGCALLARNDLPEAITNFEAALKVQPDFAFAHNSLATAFFKQGQFDEAARHFFEAAKLEPGNWQFIENLGDALARLGKSDAAADAYRRALQIAPDNPEIAAKLKAVPLVK